MSCEIFLLLRTNKAYVRTTSTQMYFEYELKTLEIAMFYDICVIKHFGCSGNLPSLPSHDITSEKTGRKRLSQYVRKVYFTKEDSGVFLSKGSINHFPEDISRTLFFTVPWSCEGSMFQGIMGVVVNFEISFVQLYSTIWRKKL